MHKATMLKMAAASVSLALLAACGNKEEVKTVAAKPAPPPAAPAPVSTSAVQPAAAAAPVATAAPAPAAPAPAPAAAPAPAPTPVLASAEFINDPQLRADLLEVKRVSGGSLTVRWRVVNTAGQSGGLAAAEPKKIRYSYDYHQLYYTDPAENKKYQFLSDTQQNRLIQVFEGDFAAGQQRGNWAKFPAPPATSKKITVHIPNFPPFEDVPVAD